MTSRTIIFKLKPKSNWYPIFLPIRNDPIRTVNCAYRMMEFYGSRYPPPFEFLLSCFYEIIHKDDI